MEMDDLEETMRIIGGSESNARWQYMADILVPFPRGNAIETLPEVLHFES
jgi:L-rhamnose mutarotase